MLQLNKKCFSSSTKSSLHTLQISNTLSLSPIYHAKGIFKIDNIKQSCKELMKIEWQQEIQSKPKLRTYKLMKENFDVESYVAYHVPKNYRSIFTGRRSEGDPASSVCSSGWGRKPIRLPESRQLWWPSHISGYWRRGPWLSGTGGRFGPIHQPGIHSGIHTSAKQF